jgi:predicted MFS family arabinose efflux permease
VSQPSAPRASTTSLVLLALSFGLGQNVIRPVIAPQAVALGGDALSAGLVVAAQGVGGLLVALPVGALMSRVGGRRIVAVGAVGFVLGAGLMVVATTPFALGLGHLVFGAGGVGAWLAGQTMATVAEDDAASRRKIARVSTAALLGLLGGPPLGGILTDLISVRAAFVAALVSGVCLFPVLFALPRSARTGDPTTAAPDEVRATSPARPAGGMWGRPGLVAMLVTSCLAQALQTIRQSFLPLHLEGVGWSATQIGVVLSVAGVGALAARSAFTALDRGLGGPALLALCLLPGAVTLGTAVTSASAAVIVASVFVSGFSLGLAQPVTLLGLARITSERERGPAVGMRVFGNRCMQAAAPVAFGGLAAMAGLVPTFWAFAGLGVVAGAVVSRAYQRPS